MGLSLDTVIYRMENRIEKSQSAINIRLISISSQPHISHTCMSPHGNASCGGAEDPEATQVGDLGVDAREAGGAHGA